MIYISHYNSPLGCMTMASDGGAIAGLWFDGQKYDRAAIKNAELREEELPIFEQTKRWLDIYFGGKDPDFMPAIKLEGSAFKRLVTEMMLKIPFGSTMTYGEIAAMIAAQMGRKSMSAQAVGGAVGHNQISILVPCHRVVGASGKLTGYAGGIDKKRYLLELEGICSAVMISGNINSNVANH